MASPKQFPQGQHKAMAAGEKVTGMKKGGVVKPKSAPKPKFGKK